MVFWDPESTIEPFLWYILVFVELRYFDADDDSDHIYFLSLTWIMKYKREGVTLIKSDFDLCTQMLFAVMISIQWLQMSTH